MTDEKKKQRTLDSVTIMSLVPWLKSDSMLNTCSSCDPMSTYIRVTYANPFQPTDTDTAPRNNQVSHYNRLAITSKGAQRLSRYGIDLAVMSTWIWAVRLGLRLLTVRVRTHHSLATNSWLINTCGGLGFASR